MAADASGDGAIDSEAAAMAGLYAVLARAFEHPDDELHAAYADGRLQREVQAYVDRSDVEIALPNLRSEDDYEDCCARYNDLFVIGFSEYQDRTDGSLDSDGPPVALYESAYRESASWNDVNLDLARAYDYFGLGVDESDRDNHDALGLQLEFAAYLCRREAAVSEDAGRARLDLLDRHLHVVSEGVADRLAGQPGTDIFGAFGELLRRVVAADRARLVERYDDGTAPDGHTAGDEAGETPEEGDTADERDGRSPDGEGT